MPVMYSFHSNILVGPEAAIGGKSNRRTAPPTFKSRGISQIVVGF
ncbi:hypothetical protein FX985_02127 [Pseudomonas extremaustralis]|uniref:Uncharacterized protein n=1 Tax=Pseudomonas extremaustralis TaxID=359110 RepID=A0A5M9IZQ8_9PSED|nr:hypothetical protein FX985_02127 [Pseudomonas extremaustralis]